jgi:large subunit ribosomal protein L22
MTGPKTNEREGTRAVLRNTRTSSYKIREVLDLVRNRPVGEARDILRFSERDAAALVLKLLNSAIANAENNDGMEADELFVSACFADEGRTYKTFRPRARGRAGRLRKRTAHVTIIVSRLPEDRLGHVKAKIERAEADRRARRVAASQKKEGGGRTRRTRRRGGAEGTAAGDEALTPAEKEAQAIVEHEETVAAEEAAREPEAQDEETTDAEASGGAAEDAGIVDQQDAALEQAKQADEGEPAGSDGKSQDEEK